MKTFWKIGTLVWSIVAVIVLALAISANNRDLFIGGLVLVASGLFLIVKPWLWYQQYWAAGEFDVDNEIDGADD